MEISNYRVIVFSKSGSIIDVKISADEIVSEGEVIHIYKEKQRYLIVPARCTIIEKI